MSPLPPGVVVFGPRANCTLDICPVEISVYGYRPSLAVNVVFIALYAMAMAAHVYLGIRWRSYFFMASMLLGCINALVGYAGRVMMYYNPFSFPAFMIQIICVTSVPVYFCAAIYVTLAAAVEYFNPGLSRFKPKFFYWIFIPCDIFSLVVQAAGGGLATSSAGTSQAGVDLGLVGLSTQVLTMVIFCGFFADYLVRYFRSDPSAKSFGLRLKAFFGFLGLAFVLILVRCAYRLAELHEGYRGGLVRNEGLFIGFEGVMVVISVYCLMVGHPGFVFSRQSSTPKALSEDEAVTISAKGTPST